MIAKLWNQSDVLRLINRRESATSTINVVDEFVGGNRAILGKGLEEGRIYIASYNNIYNFSFAFEWYE